MKASKHAKQQRSQVLKALAESRQLVELHEELVITLNKSEEPSTAAQKALDLVRFNHAQLLSAVLGVVEPSETQEAS